MKTIKIGDDPSVYATGNYNCKTSTTGTSIPKQKPKELDWEKEFDEEFKSLANEYCDPTNDVKDFISKTLQQQREMDYKKFEKQLKAEIKRYRNLPGDTDFHKGRFCYAKELLQSLKENK